MSTASLWVLLVFVNAALWALVGVAVLLVYGTQVILLGDVIGSLVMLVFIGVLRLVGGPD